MSVKGMTAQTSRVDLLSHQAEISERRCMMTPTSYKNAGLLQCHRQRHDAQKGLVGLSLPIAKAMAFCQTETCGPPEAVRGR